MTVDELSVMDGSKCILQLRGVQPFLSDKYDKDVLVVSIAGQKDALKAIIAGELLASVECNPRLGGYLFDTILAMENGEEYDSRIVYSGMVYDASNAEECFNRAF